jgi:hypothetical protein
LVLCRSELTARRQLYGNTGMPRWQSPGKMLAGGKVRRFGFLLPVLRGAGINKLVRKKPPLNRLGTVPPPPPN